MTPHEEPGFIFIVHFWQKISVCSLSRNLVSQERPGIPWSCTTSWEMWENVWRKTWWRKVFSLQRSKISCFLTWPHIRSPTAPLNRWGYGSVTLGFIINFSFTSNGILMSIAIRASWLKQFLRDTIDFMLWTCSCGFYKAGCLSMVSTVKDQLK